MKKQTSTVAKGILALAMASLVMVSCDQDPKAELDSLEKQKKSIEARIAELEKIVKKPQAPEKIRPVEVYPVAPTTIRHYVDVQANVKSDKEVMLSPKMNGVVTQLFVSEGSSVAAGAVIAQLDDSALRKQLNELERSLSFAQTVYEKQKKVFEQKATSEIQFLEAKNAKEGIERTIETLQEQIDMMKVRAPFAGVVNRLMTKVGEAVAPGSPVVQLVNTSNLKVIAQVSESMSAKVSRGERVRLNFPDVGSSFEATVSAVGNAIDPASRTFPVVIPIPNTQGIKPNMLATVKLNDATRENILAVPLAALQAFDRAYSVFVVAKEGEKLVARKKNVTTGISSDDKIEILSGLQQGDRVITTGAQTLSDGDPIEILTPQAAK